MKRVLSYGLIGMMAASLTWSASALDVEVGGYVDTQFNAGWIKDHGGTSGEGYDHQTFRFNQGALRLSTESGNFGANVDLDFFGPDLTSTGGFTTPTVSQAITLGATQSQAYVTGKYSNGFDWMMGQFDGRYGFEDSDTDGIRFAQAGIIFGSMPGAHVGALLGYGFSDSLRAELVAANAYDQGHLKAGNVDLGAKVYSDMGSFNLNIGFLGSTGDHDVAGLVKEFGYLFDIDVAMEVSHHEVALYGFFQKDDHKDALKDWGVGLDVGHDPDVGLGYGLRLEWAEIDTNKIIEATLGPQWHFSADFVGKFDYTYQSTHYTSYALTNQVEHLVNVAAVYNF